VGDGPLLSILTTDYELVERNRYCVHQTSDISIEITLTNLGAFYPHEHLSLLNCSPLEMFLFQFGISVETIAVSLTGELGSVVDYFDALPDMETNSIRLIHSSYLSDVPKRFFQVIALEQQGYHTPPSTDRFLKSVIPQLRSLPSDELFGGLHRLLSYPGDGPAHALHRLHSLHVLNTLCHGITVPSWDKPFISRIEAILTWYYILAGTNEGLEQWRMYFHALCDNIKRDDDLSQVLKCFGLNEAKINLMLDERKQITIAKKCIKRWQKKPVQEELETIFKHLTTEAKLVYMAHPKDPKARSPIALHLALQHANVHKQSG